MLDAHSQRFSRRAMREYGALLTLIAVSALVAMSLFATSAPGIPRRHSTAESETAEGRKVPTTRRSLSDRQLISLATAGDGTMGTPEQPGEASQGSQDAAPPATSPLYSSVESYARYPLSAAKVEAGKGCGTTCYLHASCGDYDLQFPVVS